MRACRGLAAWLMLAFMPSGALAAEAPLQVDVRIYFADAAAEAHARDLLRRDLQALQQGAPGQAEARFHAFEALYARCLRHHAWFELANARNVHDTASATAQDEVDGLCGDIAADARTALRSAPAGAAWAQPYAWYIERARPRAVQPPAAGAGDAIEALADPALDVFGRLYRDALNAGAFPSVRMDGKAHDSRIDRAALMASTDERVREQAWHAYWQGMAQRRELMADTLVGLVRVSEGQARLQGHASAADAAYRQQRLDPTQVQAMLAAVQRHAGRMQALQRAGMDRALASGAARVRAPWNEDAPLPGQPALQLDPRQIQRAATAAAAPLGEEYQAIVRALLDPDGQRMDLDGDGARAMDAFSISAPGVPSVIFAGHRSNSLASAVQVVHESGHGVHGQWMDRSHASPLFRNGTGWLNEAFAIYTQMAFESQLQRDAADPLQRQALQRALVQDMAFQLFGSAEEAQLEQAIHEGIMAGRVRSADDLDALTLEVMAPYDSWIPAHPELGATWQTKRLFFQDPYYLSNYLFSGLVAVRLYALERADPVAFRQRYLAVLGDGFDRAPQAMLERLLGEPLDWDRLIEQDMQQFDLERTKMGDGGD